MSDFMPRDTIADLWDEILNRQWTYLDTEENIVKLEARKKFEDCLKEFLCIVQHDRKFFLPETAEVLKNSIRDLESFNAQDAITAFESISQYANNLFTKPWRKEFRILKMYSGFYQHEIKSNLLHAEILFEAMGYRRLSEDALILDEPICPDQVANVSRDAMIAYVELQIMKHIHTGLDAVGINCSWLDIYRHREKHTGGGSEAVKNIAYSVEEKRFRSRQTTFTGDNYGYIDVQPSSNYLSSNTQFCPAQCQCTTYYQQVPPVSRHRPIAQPNGICCLPEHHQKTLRTATNLVHSNNMAYPTHHTYQYNHHHNNPGMTSDNGGVPLAQMSHSRSLDHYSQPANRHHNILPQRHSFDHQQQGCTTAHQYHQLQHQNLQQQQQEQQQQQQSYYQHHQPQQNFYESQYDCVDGNSIGGGSSTISYAAVSANSGAEAATTRGGIIGGGGSSGGGGGGMGINCTLNSSSTYSHPYNVSGNRFPLPLNISNQFSTYDNLQSTNYSGPKEPTYAYIADQHLYSSVPKVPQHFMMNTNATSYNNQSSSVHGLQNPLVKDSFQRQHSCQSEQLINFEDPTTTAQQQFKPLNPYLPNNDTSNHITDKQYNVRNIMENPLPPLDTTTCQQHCVPNKPSTNDDMYVYAKPTSRENRKQNALNLRKYPYNSGEQGDTTDISYESTNDDFVELPCEENESNHLSSPTQFSKNQEGFGSIEHWNCVYRNLEKNGYSKDLGDRSDLLVESLDLDSLNINNDTSPSQSSSTEKRRNENISTMQRQQIETKQKYRTPSKNNAKVAKSVCTTSSTNNSKKRNPLLDNNTRKIKSALKQTNSTSNPNPSHNPNKTQPKTNDNKTVPKTRNNNNNNNNDSLINSSNGITQRKNTSSSSAVNTTKKSLNPPPSISTQIIVTSDNGWGCRFCTFINPVDKRICEMCCHTNDFNLGSSSPSSNAAEGTTIAQNTPTCA